MTQRGPVVCIVGPTATGKSDLGVWLAQVTGGEVISADSMQVYRKMDIGTAKMTPVEMQGVPHHLIDVVDPDQPYTVAQWTQQADAIIGELHSKGKLPIVVGGTGLYIRGIVEDLNFGDHVGSPAIREKWQEFAHDHGPAALHRELALRDPQSANRLHENDVRRIVRALELYDVTGQPMSDDYDWRPKGGRYETLQFGLEMPRDRLYRRVEQRIDRMLDKGLLEEVQGLLDQGYDPDLQSMQAIGYKEPVQYLTGQIGFESCIDLLKRNTRRFAKRQLSWFRRDERVRWLTMNELSAVEGHAQAVRDAVLQLMAGI